MFKGEFERLAHRLPLAGCIVVFVIASQLAMAERLPLKAYTIADGLPHNTINKIVRDSRGFLWFCTAEGLSRFDGYTFTNFTTDHGLPHRNITDFLETRTGEFWVSTNAGLVRFNQKGIPANRVVEANETSGQTSPMFSVVLPSDEDRQAKVVNVLLEGRDGTLWCGTAKHLYSLERSNGRFELLRAELGNSSASAGEIHILDLLEDRHGSLWVAAFGWLCRRWPDGSTACYTNAMAYQTKTSMICSKITRGDYGRGHEAKASFFSPLTRGTFRRS